MDTTNNVEPLDGRPRLLVIDTCGETAGVALSAGREIVAAEDILAGRASAEIVSSVSGLLQRKRWKLAGLDAVSVVRGPGSFTGIRAGLAAAKGLCEAAGLRLIAVSRLEVLADAAAHGAFVALNAGRGEVYVRARSTGREWLCSIETLVAMGMKCQDAGDSDCGGDGRVVIAEQQLAERLDGCEVVLRPLHVSDALGLVLRRFAAGGDDVSLADANYLREESDIYRRQPAPQRVCE